jgi:hypothetical protein
MKSISKKPKIYFKQKKTLGNKTDINCGTLLLEIRAFLNLQQIVYTIQKEGVSRNPL